MACLHVKSLFIKFFVKIQVSLLYVNTGRMHVLNSLLFVEIFFLFRPQYFFQPFITFHLAFVFIVFWRHQLTEVNVMVNKGDFNLLQDYCCHWSGFLLFLGLFSRRLLHFLMQLIIWLRSSGVSANNTMP